MQLHLYERDSMAANEAIIRRTSGMHSGMLEGMAITSEGGWGASDRLDQWRTLTSKSFRICP